jgi:CRISPR type III-A-associated RAMP protein Csm5
MKIKIKTLYPVHIGSGAEISPLEYYRENNAIIRVDMDSLFHDPAFSPVIDAFAASASTERSISTLVAKEILEKHPLYKISAIGEAARANQTTIKEFIKSAGRVFLPGSSLKGVFLSAVCWYILSQDYKKNEKEVLYRNNSIPVVDYIKNNLLSNRDGYKELLGYVLSRILEQNENQPIEPEAFSRWLRVIDSDLKEPSDCLQVAMVKVTGGKKTHIPVLCETLKPGTEWIIELKSTSRLSPQNILQITNAYYKKIATLENTRIDTSANASLLRLGQGASMFSTSFYLLAEEIGLLEEYCQAQNLHRPVTSKRVNGQMPLGWAEVSCHE